MPLELALKRRELTKSNCFFCIIQLEDTNHCIQSPIACQIWGYVSQIWHVLSCFYLMPRQWVFAQFTQLDLNSEMEIVFFFLRSQGLCHNQDLRKAFVFDGRHGVSAYLQTLKGVLMLKLFPHHSVCLAYLRFNMSHYMCSGDTTQLLYNCSVSPIHL